MCSREGAWTRAKAGYVAASTAFDTANWTPAQLWDRLVYASICLIISIFLGVVVCVIVTATVFRDEFRALASCANFTFQLEDGATNFTARTNSEVTVRIRLIESIRVGNLSACEDSWIREHSVFLTVPALLIALASLVALLICVSQRLCRIPHPPRMRPQKLPQPRPTPGMLSLFSRGPPPAPPIDL